MGVLALRHAKDKKTVQRAIGLFKGLPRRRSHLPSSFLKNVSFQEVGAHGSYRVVERRVANELRSIGVRAFQQLRENEARARWQTATRVRIEGKVFKRVARGRHNIWEPLWTALTRL